MTDYEASRRRWTIQICSCATAVLEAINTGRRELRAGGPRADTEKSTRFYEALESVDPPFVLRNALGRRQGDLIGSD